MLGTSSSKAELDDWELGWGAEVQGYRLMKVWGLRVTCKTWGLGWGAAFVFSVCIGRVLRRRKLQSGFAMASGPQQRALSLVFGK